MAIVAERSGVIHDRPSTRWIWVFACAAIGLLWAVPLIEQPLNVQVRWADNLTEEQKRDAARQLGLRLLDVRGDGITRRRAPSVDLANATFSRAATR